MSTLKLVFLIISTCILVSGVRNEDPAPTPADLAKEMQTALDALVTGKCWKVADVADVAFTPVRRVLDKEERRGRVLAEDTCNAAWKTVVTKWTANNTTTKKVQTDFNAAMAEVKLCVNKKRRRLDDEKDNCKAGEDDLKKALDLLATTLGDEDSSKKFVDAAKDVTIGDADNDVEIKDDANGAAYAKKESENQKKLRDDCTDKKLMTWPAAATNRRRAEEVKDDEDCNKALKAIVDSRASKIKQVTDLIAKVAGSECTTTSRRLKRIMRNKRIRILADKKDTCATTEKAVRVALANLTLSAASGIMSLVAVGFAAVAAMFI